MTSSGTLHSAHEDVIHDLSFDEFGKLIATCSSDRTIKIWKRDFANVDKNGGWSLFKNIPIDDGEVLAGSGPVFRVRWASSMFGAVLGVANDSSVRVYEMVPESTIQRRTTSSMFRGAVKSDRNPRCNQRMSMKKMTLRASGIKTESRVKDIGFCPVHFDGGLVLGCALREGVIFFQRSIHEHTEYEPFKWKSFEFYAHPDLNQELLASSLKQSGDLMTTLECQSLSWNKSRWEDPSFVVGYDYGQISIFVFRVAKHSGINNNGKSKRGGARGSSGSTGSSNKRGQSSCSSAAELSLSSDKEWVCVSLFNVFEMKNGIDYTSNNLSQRKLSAPGNRIVSIDWAAHLSRKEHRIACGCSDGLLRIVAVSRVSASSLLGMPTSMTAPTQSDITTSMSDATITGSSDKAGSISASPVIHARLEFESKEGHSGRAIESVKWNSTGSLLCSACAGGMIVIWKRMVGGRKWAAIATTDSTGPFVMKSLPSSSSDYSKPGLSDDSMDEDSCFHILNRLVDLPTQLTQTYHSTEDEMKEDSSHIHRMDDEHHSKLSQSAVADEDTGFYFE